MNNCLMVKIGLMLMAAAAVTPGSIFAQEFRAQISGQLMDPSGGAIPQGTVTATKSDSQQAYTGKSDAAGVYSLLYLLPGEYVVRVQAPGFQQMVYNDVRLE